MKAIEIPLIEADLRHEETIVQIANVFEYLDQVVNRVFDKINDRIDKNSSRLKSIEKRISLANEKVDYLGGIQKKAIVMMSPGKYPGGSTFNTVPMTFGADDFKDIQLQTDYKIESSYPPLDPKNYKDKLQFYHVKTKEVKRDLSSNDQMGLGDKIPNFVNSVNDLLIYNTQENPYQFYGKKVDPLSDLSNVDVCNKSLQDENVNKSKLEDAPYSIINRNSSIRRQNDELFYVPTMNDAPELDMPDDLPDLPGIASDAFEVRKEISIPKIEPKEEPIQIETPKFEEISEIKTISKLQSIPEPAERTSLSTTTPLPPPPPPPPMPVSSSTPLELSPAKNAPISPVVSDSTNARSNLMAAIRQAGGKAKKKVMDESTKLGIEKEAPKSSGNLMDDLHNKLLLRRKGISGAKDGAGNVMDRVSAMIPPPPKPTAHVPSSEDDDWN